MFLFLIQIAVPLVLVAILAIRTRQRVTKLLQAVAVFGYLSAVHLAGLWLDWPFWTPWVYWALFGFGVVVGWRPRDHLSPSGWRGRAAPAFWGLAAIGTAPLAAAAVLARVPPAGEVVDLSPALPPGRYLVVNGGNSSLTNAHFETLQPRTPRQAAHRGQSHGVDIVGLTPLGLTSRPWRAREPGRHAIFAAPIIAPCSGRVVVTLDGRPDMPVPIADEQVMAGNHVLLQCGDIQVLLAHMRRGSVAVRQGQLVRAGQRLGEVGNSGSSNAPHLHIHVQRPGTQVAPFDADPLPFRIEGRYPVRGDRL